MSGPTTVESASGRLDPRLIRLALIMSLGSIAALLDTTIVSVAIDRLGREFGSPVATVQWVGTAYLLALTAVVPITGWSVRRFGARRMWLVSLTVFLGGSVLCGLAWSIGSLIVFRVLQGLGGGMLLPLVRIVLAERGGTAGLGRMMTFVMVPGQLAPILGPMVGGLVISTLDWRWAFWINAPICLAALVLSRRRVHGAPSGTGGPLDVRGLLLLSPGLAALVYGLTEFGGGGEITAPGVVAGLVAGVALLTGYVVHALGSRVPPILDLRLFRDRSFAASSALVFVFGVSLFGAMLLLPLFYQQVRGADALHAGLLLAPQGVGSVIAMLFVGKLVDRTGAARPIVMAGLALAVAGTLPYALAGPDTSDGLLAVALVVRGIGLGTALIPTMSTTYATLPAADFAAATGGSRILQQIGGSVGIAVLAVVLQRATRSADSAAAGFGTAFWVSIAVTALAFAAAAALPGRRAAGS